VLHRQAIPNFLTLKSTAGTLALDHSRPFPAIIAAASTSALIIKAGGNTTFLSFILLYY
jgi:hypothetical protein